jgi:hypothetical protein
MSNVFRGEIEPVSSFCHETIINQTLEKWCRVCERACLKSHPENAVKRVLLPVTILIGDEHDGFIRDSKACDTECVFAGKSTQGPILRLINPTTTEEPC